MQKKFFFILILILFSITLILHHNLYSDNYETGKITQKVECLNDPAETYALYLPELYSPEKKWPVIIAFEPGARSTIPVKLFRNSAEKYGYIVACSNNSKNGPWIDIIRSMKAVWNDLVKRFSINYSRVYTTGFSGGSRAASLFSKIIGIEPAGIIACGAGIQEKLKPSDLGGSFYYGIIGLEDFNYKEIRRLVPGLKKANIRYCIDYIPGIHKWPDEEVVSRAISWMEIDAVLRKSVKEDSGFVKKTFRRLRGYANTHFESENFFYGILYLDGIAKHFKMLLPIDEFEKEVNNLMKEKRFVQFNKEDDLRLKREYEYIRNFALVFNRIESDSHKWIGLQSVLKELKVPYLVKLNRKKIRTFDSFEAKRLLFEIAIKADRTSYTHLKKGNEKKALLYAEIASKTGTNEDWYDLRLASVYAFYGKKKKCIKIVKSLLRLGKALIKYIERDPNFNEMLKDPDFMKIFIKKN